MELRFPELSKDTPLMDVKLPRINAIVVVLSVWFFFPSSGSQKALARKRKYTPLGVGQLRQ
jgi:hypothetical protein